MKKILIVDDEPRITRILDLQLRDSGYDTIVTHTGEDAVKIALAQDIALVLMDVMMPGMDGREAMQLIKEQKPALPVLLLTARDDIKDIVSGLNQGADEYVTKPFVYEELEARIKARIRAAERYDATALGPNPVLQTNSGLQSNAASEMNDGRLQIGEILIDTNTFQMFVQNNECTLSKTEFSLLYFLMINRDRVLSRDQLLKHVWGYTYSGSNVVDVYINYLREKISRHSDKKYIETVRGRGYLFNSSPSEKK